MSIHYLLDGYNIVHQMPGSRPDRREDHRLKLIRFIEKWSPQGSRNNDVTVVFDGHPDMLGGVPSGPVKVVFSQGESADDRICKMVAKSKNPKTVTVVTDDRAVQFSVRALGAKAVSVESFLAKGRPAVVSKKVKKAKAVPEEKYISKTDELNITEEMERIWLDSDKDPK